MLKDIVKTLIKSHNIKWYLKEILTHTWSKIIDEDAKSEMVSKYNTWTNKNVNFEHWHEPMPTRFMSFQKPWCSFTYLLTSVRLHHRQTGSRDAAKPPQLLASAELRSGSSVTACHRPSVVLYSVWGAWVPNWCEIGTQFLIRRESGLIPRRNNKFALIVKVLLPHNSKHTQSWDLKSTGSMIHRTQDQQDPTTNGLPMIQDPQGPVTKIMLVCPKSRSTGFSNQNHIQIHYP